MVTGWMLFTGTDTKGRRLLYIKKKNAYYLLPQHREFAITLWKHAEINAISISIILGYFLFHKIAGTKMCIRDRFNTVLFIAKNNTVTLFSLFCVAISISYQLIRWKKGR